MGLHCTTLSRSAHLRELSLLIIKCSIFKAKQKVIKATRINHLLMAFTWTANFGRTRESSESSTIKLQRYVCFSFMGNWLNVFVLKKRLEITWKSRFSNDMVGGFPFKRLRINLNTKNNEKLFLFEKFSFTFKSNQILSKVTQLHWAFKTFFSIVSVILSLFQFCLESFPKTSIKLTLNWIKWNHKTFPATLRDTTCEKLSIVSCAFPACFPLLSMEEKPQEFRKKRRIQSAREGRETFAPKKKK